MAKKKEKKRISDMRAEFQITESNDTALLSDADVVRDYNARFGFDTQYIGIDAFGKKVKAAPAIQICATCEVSASEYKLINGDETTRCCEGCMKDLFLDLVKTNYQVKIYNNDKGADGLIELELS